MRRLIFLLIIGGVGFAALIGLGVWQLQRLAQKEDLLRTIETNMTATPVALPLAPTQERDRYRAVAVAGEVEGDELHVFWVTKDADTGYRVIARFVTTDGRRILLDRGFIPAAQKDAIRAYGVTSVSGNLLWPDEGDWTTPAPDVDANILYARDVAYMAERLETEPVLIVARRADPEADVTPHAVTSVGIPNNHLQYAITWFSLALIWAAMTIYFLRRSRPEPKS